LGALITINLPDLICSFCASEEDMGVSFRIVDWGTAI
jgi:hypothetical protein